MTHPLSTRPPRILVVDDNPSNLGVLVGHLERHGHEVLVALGGLEALDRVTYARPDLILLDVMMPDIDGFETCRRLKLREDGRDIPVIFMTALTDTDSRVSAFAAGGVDCVSKPFQIEELMARVRTHLALRQAQSALLDSELRHRRLFETAGDGILVLDCEDGTVVDLNAQASRMLGADAATLRGRPIEAIQVLQAQGGRAIVDILRHAGQAKWDEWAWHTAGGMPVCVEVLATTYRTHDRLVAQCTFRDIRARKDAEARVRHMALHDALTGLPNRTLLMDRVTQGIAKARRDDNQLALLLLDLDHFKHINDSLGHFVGDGLLEQVSKRLRHVVRGVDTPARLGGDEFVIAACDLDGPADAEILAQRILDAMAPDFQVEGHNLRIGTSIGISLYPSDGDNPAALLQAADTAMYQAKKKGRGTYRLFTRDLSIAAERWHTLSADLHGACERGEFVLHYQPQYRMDRANGPSRVSGMEALLRWIHPREGLIEPGLFIPLLEEHGLMAETGRWALRAACAQNAAWQAQGLPPARVAVNVSAQQFYRGDIVRAVREALDESGLSPQWLELELTESLTLDDTELTLRLMHDLKTMGVKLSLDDFGTGWSSLAYLKRFPLDRLKIDRAFVRDIVTDASTAAIIGSILDLAQQLHLDCVAEGVETVEQLQRLRDAGCPEIQGFLFSRPVPADQIPALLSGEVRLAAA